MILSMTGFGRAEGIFEGKKISIELKSLNSKSFDLNNLPFEDESFDYVTAHDVLEHILRVATENGKTTFPL